MLNCRLNGDEDDERLDANRCKSFLGGQSCPF